MKNLTVIRKDFKYQNIINTVLKTNPVIISFLSGIILALSMPGFNWSFLAWVGFIPLFLIISEEQSLKRNLTCFFTFGLGFNLLSLSWLLDLHPITWLGFNNDTSFVITRMIWLYISTYASYYVVFFGLAVHFIYKTKFKILAKSFLIAFLWILATNKLMSFGDFAFPYAMIEYSQYKNLLLLQFAQFIGGIGISFIIVFLNSFIALNIHELMNKKVDLKFTNIRVFTVVTFVLLAHIAGFVMLIYSNKPDKVLTATVIQGNIKVEQEKQNVYALEQSKKYFLEKIEEAPSGLIVVPETAFFDLIRFNDNILYKKLLSISQKQNKTIIVGAVDAVYNRNGSLSPTNSAIVFDSQNYKPDKNIYNKQFLVPFGEYKPFPKFTPKWLRKFASTAAQSDFSKGTEIKVINTICGNIAPSICYEIIFPDITKNQVQNNADILVGLSNLSWFHDSIIKDQFIAFSVMRAAESRRPLVLSVNTGSSVIIDFTGRILKKLPKNSNGTASIKLGYINEKSWFSKGIF
jgi:apolipoprotein N-acyltransferase